MKYTFINVQGQEQTIDVPQEYIDKQMRSLGCNAVEACDLYVYDEGYADDETANQLNEKAAGTKKRRGPKCKADPIKRGIIEYILRQFNEAAITTADGHVMTEETAVVNPERIVQFKIYADDDTFDTYEITLSRKRKPKA